jgi:hypothetical protein
MNVYWVCMAHRWVVPPIECDARGNGTTAAGKHTEDTHHPTVTTTHEDFADRLAEPQKGSL